MGTLHPLLTEIVRELAGDYLEVEELLGPGADPHVFEPSPGDLRRVHNAAIVFAMGKNLETYLDRLENSLSADTVIFEVGSVVPSLHIDPEHEAFACCPDHSHGALDPHWWHSPLAMHRATRHIGSQLETLLPNKAQEIRTNTRQRMRDLEDLHLWVLSQVRTIPASQRKLVTAHAAFGYFCEAYGFQSIPVRGLTAERDPSASYLAETVRIIRRENIRAVFPENIANPAILDFLREETQVQIGPTLYADNVGEETMGYIEMMRHNVSSIVSALTAES